jgi:trigger factor
MADIQIKKTAEEPGATSLAVVVPIEHVREAEERTTSAYRQRARLPGFRKGKAPTTIVKKQFGEDIRHDVLEQLIRESWKAALKQESLQPIADPHIHNLKWDPGAPVTFEFRVEVRPVLALDRLGGFRLTRTVTPVTDEQVTAQLNELRDQRAPWVPVAGEAPKPKDLVSVTVASRSGSEVTDPQDYQIVVGDGRAIPELEERIMELTPGQARDATVRFPDDFPEEAKRGQTRDIRVTLHEVKRQTLPDLDDAFAREVGDFESLVALRQAVRTDLERDAVREADAHVRSAMIEQIVAANQVAAPRPLVDRTLVALAQAYGIPEDRFEGFAKEFRPIAEGQVRRDLILNEVIDRQHIAVTPAELDQRIAELAQRRSVTPTELRASLEKAKRLRDLEHSMLEEKVFSYLLSLSTVESS